MFAGPAILFLIYAGINAVLLYNFVTRFFATVSLTTLPEKTQNLRTLSRAVFVVISFFLVLDNIRIFSGGFWGDEPTAPNEGENFLVPASAVPPFAKIFNILVFSHLVLVPIAIIPLGQVGFTIPSYLAGQPVADSDLIKKLRLGSFILAGGLAGLGFFNLLGELAAIDEYGYEATNFRGIITYTTPNETMIFEEGGFQGIEGTALFGVIGMSLVSVVVGAALWWKTDYKLFAILCVVCLLGQGAGPMFLGNDFSFLSNLLEAVLFIAIALVERKFWGEDIEKAKSQIDAMELGGGHQQTL